MAMLPPLPSLGFEGMSSPSSSPTAKPSVAFLAFTPFGPCTFAKRPLTRGLLSASVLRHAYLIFLKPMVTA